MSGTALLAVRTPVAGNTVGLIGVEVPTKLPTCELPDIPVAGRIVGPGAGVPIRLPTCGLADVASKVKMVEVPCVAMTAVAVAAIVVVFFGSAITSGRCKTGAGPGLLVLDISMRAFAGNGAMAVIKISSVFLFR